MSEDRISELEKRIEGLEAEIQRLKNADAEREERVETKALRAEIVEIVEADGTLRMSLHNKQRMRGPDSRKGGQTAGMLFFDEQGRENGGLTVADTVSLMFDQEDSDQVVGLVNYGEAIRGLYVWDWPPGPFAAYKEKFIETHGRPPRPQEVHRPRVFLGRWLAEEAKLSLSDDLGRERIRLLVDGDGEPRLEFLDEKGKILKRLTSREEDQPDLPPTDDLTEDRAGHTVAHWLWLNKGDIDKTLETVDTAEDWLGAETQREWRGWLTLAREKSR